MVFAGLIAGLIYWQFPVLEDQYFLYQQCRDAKMAMLPTLRLLASESIASGYTERAFRSIQVGDNMASVREKLGAPLHVTTYMSLDGKVMEAWFYGGPILPHLNEQGESSFWSGGPGRVRRIYFNAEDRVYRKASYFLDSYTSAT